MELPQTVEWALHCCWLLAQTDGSPVPRRRLAEFFDLPEPYLAKLLKALVAAEVLTSVPGVNGGYRLARPAGQVTALDVVRAVNGHTAMFHCAEIRQRGPVGLTAGQCLQPCGIAKAMYNAELAWRNALAAVTVAGLTENAADVSADRAARWLGPQARAGLAPARPLAWADNRTERTGAPMELTKHTHACVTFDKGGSRLLVDPGAFTPNRAELAASAGTILITHEHFDHFDEEAIAAALDARPELRVYGPAAVVDRWQARRGQVTAVVEGERFDVDGFDVAVFGGLHAAIHRDIPQVANVGYLIDGHVYHPGDSYFVPAAPVTTLLVPTSGPWTKFGEAADFVRAVNPERAVQIHEIMLSEIGQQTMATFLSPKMLTDVALTIVPVGDTITV